MLEPEKPELFLHAPRGPQFIHSNLWLKPEWRPNQAAPTISPWPTPTSTLLHSDSEMEMDAEHYPNGVLESMSTRIVNGAYKHEDLQTDESSMGEGHAQAWCSMGSNTQSRCPPTPACIGGDWDWQALPDLVHCLLI